jgi:hypothetical protein
VQAAAIHEHGNVAPLEIINPTPDQRKPLL